MNFRSMRKHLLLPVVVGSLVMLTLSVHAEEDPFAEGIDALAVNEGDGSMSLRAKKKLTKLAADMVLVRIKSVDDKTFPHCAFTAQVLKTAKAKDKHFKLLGRGRVYRFQPILKQKEDSIDLTDDLTQNNLGACYYPKKTRLALRISGVDVKGKAFQVSELYLR